MYLRFNRGSDAWEYTPAGPEADEWLAVTESESYLKAWAAATVRRLRSGASFRRADPSRSLHHPQFKDSGRKQHASTAVLSDADAGLLAFLAKYHPHPGALGGGSMCTIKLPDAYVRARARATPPSATPPTTPAAAVHDAQLLHPRECAGGFLRHAQMLSRAGALCGSHAADDGQGGRLYQRCERRPWAAAGPSWRAPRQGPIVP